MAGEIDRILSLINETGGVDQVGLEEDFYEAGFSSVNALALLLELETAFDVSIPDDKFVEARTPLALEAMIVGLKQDTTG
jgi:acyl carrier protein